MKKTIKMIVIMTIVAIIMGITNISNAFSFNANLSSNDKLVGGQEVKVTLSLSGIDMDDGIRSIKVNKITVGEEFEAVASANFTSNTFMPTYSNGGLVLMSGTPIKDNAVAVTLTLKVKSGITANSSTIKFENIVASSGSNTGDISVGTKTITIKANESSTSGNEPGTTNPDTTGGNTQNGTKPSNSTNTSSPTNPSTLGTSNTIQSGTSQGTGKSDTKNTISSSTAKGTLPKAGSSEGVVMISVILIVAVVGVITFIRYNKIKKDSE